MEKQETMPIEVVQFLLHFGKEDLSEGLSYFIKSIDRDDYYFRDLLIQEGVVSEELGSKLFDIAEKLTYAKVFEWYKSLTD